LRRGFVHFAHFGLLALREGYFGLLTLRGSCIHFGLVGKKNSAVASSVVEVEVSLLDNISRLAGKATSLLVLPVHLRRPPGSMAARRAESSLVGEGSQEALCVVAGVRVPNLW